MPEQTQQLSVPKQRANFAEAVKHGITSYSPFKQHVVKNPNEDEKDKKTRFGPPKVNLGDRELDDIINKTHYRAVTATSNATMTASLGPPHSPMPTQSAFHSRPNTEKHNTHSSLGGPGGPSN
jgi:hypothetical protein